MGKAPGMCLWALLACGILWGMEPVFRFSDSGEVSRWHIVSQRLSPLSLTRRFGGYGGYALRFSTPAWRGDLPSWPSCEGVPEIRDWSGHDRLVLDVTNPGNAKQTLMFYVADSRHRLQEGFWGTCHLPGGMAERFVFDVARFPKGLDLRDIHRFHVFAQRPGEPMDVFIGSIFLLRPGESMPPFSQALGKQLRELYMPHLGGGYKVIGQVRKQLAADEGNPALNRALERVRRRFEAVSGRYERLMGKSFQTVEDLQELRHASGMENRCRRLAGDMAFLRRAWRAGQDISRMAVGVADSMTHVMPVDVPFESEVPSVVRLSLARNEWESVQVVVQAWNGRLDQVDVEVSPVKNRHGESLKSVAVDVVGHVETKHRPPYAVSHVGWWPDPLLRHSRNGRPAGGNRCGAVTVKQDHVQGFWLRFHADAKQRPGTYVGRMTVTASGVPAQTLAVEVHVRSFALPVHMPLPTAISFHAPVRQMTQKHSLAHMKLVYADFLGDYLINYDSLYRQGPPDWEVVRHLRRQGRLTAFNLGNVFNSGVSSENFPTLLKETLGRLRPVYERCKELGLLDHAYIYGFDERGKDQFPLLERCLQALRQEFPEVLLMTTSYDHSYGLQSEVKSMQAWCPSTSRYDLALAERARHSGRWVWWYICCGPHSPYANWFIEYAPLDARMLMGAQAVKYRPDGFLYYSLTMWNRNMGIDCSRGAFTDWNPQSWMDYHGDGALFYCDRDGYPLPSIRLENYRDGLEDYAYACILAEALRIKKSRPALTDSERGWLAEAQEALEVPENLVSRMDEYSPNPQHLLAWRRRMAESIEASGLNNLNPWGKDFGVRGGGKRRLLEH